MSIFNISFLIFILFLLLTILSIKKRCFYLLALMAIILFSTPFYSLYEAGKSTYWTFSGDGFWTRVIYLISIDLPSLGLLGIIAFSYFIKPFNKNITKYQSIVGYGVMFLFIVRFSFHFLVNDNMAYFYIRNYFGPTVYKEVSPYATKNLDTNLTSHIKELFPNKMEQLLVLDYAKETTNIMNAYKQKEAASATERRWYIWDCMHDVIKQENSKNIYFSNRFVWKTIHNIEYTIVNTYPKYQKFNKNLIYKFDINANPKFLQLCKDPNSVKVNEFLIQLNEVVR